MGGKTIHGFFPALNGVTDDFIELIRNQRKNERVVNFEELAYRIGLESECYFLLSYIPYCAIKFVEKNVFQYNILLFSEGTCMLMLGRHLGFLRPDSVSTLTSRLAEAVRLHFLASRDAFYGFPTWRLYATSAYKNLTNSEEIIYE